MNIRDLSNTRSSPFDLIHTYEDLQQACNEGMISNSLLQMTIVSLSYEAFAENDIDNCLILLNKMDPEYLKGDAILDMKNDEIFRQTVMYLAFKLTQIGLINGEVSIMQPEGEA